MEHEDKNEKKIILRESRKTFLPMYALTILFTGIVIFFITKGHKFSQTNLTVIIIVLALGFLIPEIVRSWETCTVKADKIYITTGIIQKRHRKFFTSTITDIHYKQKLWQRMLNYGAIEINVFSQNAPIHLGTVDRPKKRIEEIEEFIQTAHKR